MSASPAPGLAQHPFCRGFDAKLLPRLAAGAAPFRKGAHEILAQEGEPASAFWLIESGHVAIEMLDPKGGRTTIQTVGPGEVVGWSWLLPPYRWQFDARTLEATEGWRIDSAWLRRQCELDHELGFHALKQLVGVMSARLAATRLRLLDLYK